MKRFYLQPEGQELSPQGGERGHYAIGQVVLRAMGITVTERDDAYAQMWELGFVRVVDHGTRVFAELFGNSLSAEQIAYFDSRRWHVEMGEKSDELCAKIEREWSGKPEDLFMAQLMAVAKMPDQSPPGYYQRSRRCHRCGSPAEYDHRYDANYCKTCNRWLEYGCRNHECAYCGHSLHFFGGVAHQQSARLTCERKRGQHSPLPPGLSANRQSSIANDQFIRASAIGH